MSRLVGGDFNVATSTNRWHWLLGIRLDYCYHSIVERQPFYFVDDSARDSQLVLRLLLRNQARLGGGGTPAHIRSSRLKRPSSTLARGGGPGGLPVWSKRSTTEYFS